MGSNVNYGSAAAVDGRSPSPSIWKDCPIAEITADPAKGMYLFEDFRHGVVGGTTLVHGQPNGLVAYAESNDVADVAIQADNDGVLMLDQDGTNDDVTVVTTGDNVAGIVCTPNIGESEGFWFEARVKVSTITNTDLGVFVGLAAPGEAKDGGMMGAVAALNDVDYIGFHVAEADGDDMTIVYNEATSGTAQSSTGQITLVADTYVRLGMKLDKINHKIRFFADGVDLGDDVAIDISAANANYPSATDMDVVIAITSGALGEDGDNLKIDWFAVGREF